MFVNKVHGHLSFDICKLMVNWSWPINIPYARKRLEIHMD